MTSQDREKLFHKYMRTSKLMFYKTHERFDKIGLSRGQPPLLMALWKKDAQSRRELSESMERKAATITKMVKRLENNGFVTSQMDDLDSRVFRVCLTNKGKDIQESVRSIHTELHSGIFKAFSEDELVMFEGFLDRIMDNMTTMGKTSKEEQDE